MAVSYGSDAGGGKAVEKSDDGRERPVVVTEPYKGSYTNRSGSITTGGVAQTLMAANPARRRLFIQNLSDTYDLWINFTTTAVEDQPSIRLSPGQVFSDDTFVSTELVSVIGSTTGQKWTAKEGS